MNCIVTAGPTYEPLDQVRRLTNFSSGRLGTELANYLQAEGHEVILLRGQQASWQSQPAVSKAEAFTTTADLRERLKTFSQGVVDGVFHAAAVSDFAFGKIWTRAPDGTLSEALSGKFSTREGPLMAELVPTSKIISELRGWYPKARLVGWKYEVDGGREQVLALARRQLTECRTDICVANGPAYGLGFGLVSAADTKHVRTREALFQALRETLVTGI